MKQTVNIKYTVDVLMFLSSYLNKILVLSYIFYLLNWMAWDSIS